MGSRSVPQCDMRAHARALQDFTTGERVVLSRWWCDMPRLRSCTGHRGGINHYSAVCYMDEDRHMLSWRAEGAPVFTLAYRGSEVDSLLAMHGAECSPSSRTVLFSHHTAECYVAKGCIGLAQGDPHMIVQAILETGGEEAVSLKVVDIDLASSSPRARAAVMQEIGRRWAREASTAGMSNRRGVMWCGEVTRRSAGQMIGLRQGLGHRMGCAVLLTEDPYLQVHIPLKDLEEQLSKPVHGRLEWSGV